MHKNKVTHPSYKDVSISLHLYYPADKWRNSIVMVVVKQISVTQAKCQGPWTIDAIKPHIFLFVMTTCTVFCTFYSNAILEGNKNISCLINLNYVLMRINHGFHGVNCLWMGDVSLTEVKYYSKILIRNVNLLQVMQR